MERVARNLDYQRRMVQVLTQRGVHIQFIKEHLMFTGEDSPMANLMLSVMGAFAEFERALIRERQREGIALAKQRGAYRGRKRSQPTKLPHSKPVSLKARKKPWSRASWESVARRCISICAAKSYFRRYVGCTRG